MKTAVDISWYKNHMIPNSVFAWNYEDDFFAGYDHGKEAGIMSVADHNIAPGKKFFTWGTGPEGKRWDHILTDNDGPYLELMVGAYSDNQPDYSWLQPYETRSFSMHWYPFRDIGGVKNANLDAAVNLDVNNSIAKVGFYTTSAHPAAIVMLKAGQRILLRETVAINPGKPYVKRVPVPPGTDEHDLAASIWDGDEKLISYSPVRLEPELSPKPVASPPAPRNVMTNDELYRIGLRAQQFYDPIVNPMPYWEEALRRDPGDVLVNTVLGITCYRQARYKEAEQFFRKALERATDNYTPPKDCEAIYYLGATLKAEGKTSEAFTQFYKTTWSQAWKGAGYYSLAEIATERGDMAAALAFADRSIDSNAMNIRAQNLKAAVLRHLGRPGEAMKVLASAAHNADPLDVRSMSERWLASRDPAAAKTLACTMNEFPATAQETAAEYLSAGLWRDGTDTLLQMIAAAPDKSRIHPMVYYYLGYFANKMGQGQKAGEYYGMALTMSPDYVFPFQCEAIDVLRQAIAANPRDARAPYYLGNLLYDWQPEEATKMWEASAALDTSFAILHRNLAVAYLHRRPTGDLNRAIEELEKAVSLSDKYALHFTELDELYEQAGTPIEKRVALFEKNRDVVAGRDDSLNRAIALEVAAGKYDEAIKVMTERQFAIVEGVNLNVADHWTDAHILRGRQYLAAKRYEDALADFQTALKIPLNIPSGLGLGDDSGSRSAEAAYWTGVAYEGMGDSDNANECWSKAIGPPVMRSRRRGGMAGSARGNLAEVGPQSYYQALALEKLGQNEKARSLFQSLVKSGRVALQQSPSADANSTQSELGLLQAPRIRLAAAHYLAGLGYLGLNDRNKAKTELTEAVQASPDLLCAGATLASLNYFLTHK